jgi:hypothetical protein
VHPDEAGQEPRSAEVEAQATLGEDLGEAGVLGRHDQVTRQRHVEPGADGDTADLGDGRLRNAVQRQTHVGDVAHRRQLVTGGVAVGGLPEVGPRTEVAAGTGQHDRAVVGIAGDGPELDEQFVPHRRIGGILLLRPPQRDRDHPVGAVDGDRFEFTGVGGHVGRRY